jgi:hypothetical protein
MKAALLTLSDKGAQGGADRCERAGCGELMRRKSLERTSHAIISRALVDIRARTRWPNCRGTPATARSDNRPGAGSGKSSKRTSINWATVRAVAQFY